MKFLFGLFFLLSISIFAKSEDFIMNPDFLSTSCETRVERHYGGDVYDYTCNLIYQKKESPLPLKILTFKKIGMYRDIMRTYLNHNRVDRLIAKAQIEGKLIRLSNLDIVDFAHQSVAANILITDNDLIHYYYNKKVRKVSRNKFIEIID